MKIAYVNFKKSLRYSLCVLSVLFVPNSYTMDKSPHRTTVYEQKSPADCAGNEFFIHEIGNENMGICVPTEIINLSKTLKNLTEDLPGEKFPIPLKSPINDIESTFAILKIIYDNFNRPQEEVNSLINARIAHYSTAQVIGIVNLIQYLDCPSVNMNVFLSKIKQLPAITAEQGEIVKKLNPDLMNNVSIDYLSGLMADKNMRNNKGKIDYKQADKGIASAVFSADGTQIVACLLNSQIVVWDAKAGRELYGNPRKVKSALFSPDGTKIALLCYDENEKNIIVLNAKTGNELHNFVAHSSPVVSVAFSPDGTKIVSCSTTSLIVWDMNTGQKLYDLADNLTVWDSETSQKLYDPSGGKLCSALFSPDGTKIVSCSYGGETNSLVLWDAKTGQRLHSFGEHERYLFGDAVKIRGFRQDRDKRALFSPDSTKIVSFFSNILFLWDVKTGYMLTNLGSPFDIRSIVFSPDSTKMIAWSKGLDDNGLIVWDIRTGQKISNINKPITSALFSPDGTKIALAAKHEFILWDVKNNRQLYSFPNHKDLDALQFSADGTKIMALSNQSSLCILNFLEEDQKMMLLDALNKCTLEQKQLIYLLSLEGTPELMKSQIKNQENYQSIPDYIRDLLSQ